MKREQIKFYIDGLDKKLAVYKKAGWKGFTAELKKWIPPEKGKWAIWAIYVSFFIGDDEEVISKGISFYVSKTKKNNEIVFRAVKRLLKRKYSNEKT